MGDVAPFQIDPNSSITGWSIGGGFVNMTLGGFNGTDFNVLTGVSASISVRTVHNYPGFDYMNTMMGNLTFTQVLNAKRRPLRLLGTT
jgi:hypothetical protein